MSAALAYNLKPSSPFMANAACGVCAVGTSALASTPMNGSIQRQLK